MIWAFKKNHQDLNIFQDLRYFNSAWTRVTYSTLVYRGDIIYRTQLITNYSTQLQILKVLFLLFSISLGKNHQETSECYTVFISDCLFNFYVSLGAIFWANVKIIIFLLPHSPSLHLTHHYFLYFSKISSKN